MTISTIGAVTNLLKQHSFGFWCRVARPQTTSSSSNTHQYVRRAGDCTGPILVFCRLAHVFRSSSLPSFDRATHWPPAPLTNFHHLSHLQQQTILVRQLTSSLRYLKDASIRSYNV